jgi:APA family basic amino acid/polyamine antiporter
LIVLGLYVGLQTDVLSNNFANMGSQQNDPDGTVTVTKLAGMAILGAASNDYQLVIF